MRGRSRDSFEAWARARQQAMVRSAYLMTGDYQRAEDLAQEALIRAAQRWDVLRTGNPDAWVRTVMYRQHVSWWRRLRYESTVASVPDAAISPDGERDLMIRKALSCLTARQRAVIVLRFVEDLTVADTAATLGVSEGTVKKQTAVALHRLREAAPELDELERDWDRS